MIFVSRFLFSVGILVARHSEAEGLSLCLSSSIEDKTVEQNNEQMRKRVNEKTSTQENE